MGFSAGAVKDEFSAQPEVDPCSSSGSLARVLQLTKRDQPGYDVPDHSKPRPEPPTAAGLPHFDFLGGVPKITWNLALRSLHLGGTKH